MTSIGHAIKITETHVDDLDQHDHAIDSIIANDCTGLIVRNALPHAMVERGCAQLLSPELGIDWMSPNAGMHGGEVRTIGEAATPCFTAFQGPDSNRYAASAANHDGWTENIFGKDHPTPHLKRIFSRLFGGRAAAPALTLDGRAWAPFNYRALDPDEQIYAHHDNHYALPLYDELEPALDRDVLLSWFVTLQPSEHNGELIIYGLWGSDPNPPMLPTRFLDIEVLEREFARCAVKHRAGDLVIFDSGRHVHRVSPVVGDAVRLTMGGFLTVRKDRQALAFWS